jgi:hypothetical protein
MIKTVLSILFDKVLEVGSKDLKDHLSETRKIKIDGILFEIRKINMIDYMDGSKILYEFFSTYKTKNDKNSDSKLETNISKAKSHMIDIIMAGTVKPKLVRKIEDDKTAIPIDDIFKDWLLAQKLSQAIMDHTFNKKKMRY